MRSTLVHHSVACLKRVLSLTSYGLASRPREPRRIVAGGQTSEGGPSDSSGSVMAGFSYVYMLPSKTEPSQHYVGLTDDLHARITGPPIQA